VELAALHSIFSETPDLGPRLELQLSVATTERANTGVGFLTSISVPSTAIPIQRSEPLSGETHARVAGIEHGIGFVLFFNDGRIETLEGFTYGTEGTAALELADLTFNIVRLPVNRGA
jgi:hypothetical protein